MHHFDPGFRRQRRSRGEVVAGQHRDVVAAAAQPGNDLPGFWPQLVTNGDRADESPIVFNEDDNYGFENADNNMVAAISEHASWGFFDYRRPGEPFEEGYQSVPTDWRISSERKLAFFSLLAEVTGHEAPEAAV